MDSTQLAFTAAGIGLVIGALSATGLLLARNGTRKRAVPGRSDLPPAAIEVLHALDRFAVVLDASLSPIYANPAARDDLRISGEQLAEPDFLRRARHVLTTGATDLWEPNPDNPSDSLRVQIVRMQRRFIVVLVDDIGEEQRVNAMRRDFIANVSHELKTPIAAIGLLSEAVLEAADEPDVVRGFATKLLKQSKRLGDLSHDIIHLSEAQTAPQHEEREPVNLRELMLAEVEAHREFAANHTVDIAVIDRSPASDPVALGRPAALAAVLANLLTNAILHSPAGSTIYLRFETQGDDCLISVTDSGEGIAPQHLPRIFERFYRVDSARSREGGGTGLGLSIARHTMRGHGGDIDVHSEQGVGSTFTASFPVLEQKQLKKQRKRAQKRAQAETLDAKEIE